MSHEDRGHPVDAGEPLTLEALLERPDGLFEFVLVTVLGASVIAAVGYVLWGRFASRPGAEPRRWGRLARSSYGAWTLTWVLLAATSFTAILDSGTMRGWRLLLHVGTASVFLILLPWLILYLGWAQVGKRDRFVGVANIVFWLTAVLGWCAAGTMLVGMFPLFSTLELEWLTTAHRYLGLGMTACAILHLGAVVAPRRSCEVRESR